MKILWYNHFIQIWNYHYWYFLFRDLILEILDLQDNSKILQNVLNYLARKDKTEKFRGIWDGMKNNSQLLQVACKNDINDLVKFLVKRGCRLKTSRNTNDLIQENWSRHVLLSSYQIGFQMTQYFLSSLPPVGVIRDSRIQN